MERKNILRKSAGAALVLLLTASCSLFQMPSGEGQKGSVTLSAQVQSQGGWGTTYSPPGGDRTLAPYTGNLPYEAYRLKLIFQPQPSGTPVEVNLPDGSFTKEASSLSVASVSDIPTGTYHLTVEAYNASGLVYLKGTTAATFTVAPGLNTISGLVLAPVMSATGTGGTLLKINYPMTAVPQILGSPQVLLKKLAWPSGGGTEPSTPTDITTLAGWTVTDNFGDGITMTGDLELENLVLSSGQYEVRIKFQNFSIPFVETLHIYDNIHTGASWYFDDYSFGQKPNQPQYPDMGPVAEKIPGNGSTTKNRVVLRWKDASANEVGFVIYRRIGSDPTRQLVFQTGPNVETWTDDNAGAGLSADTDYYYEIFSATFAGTSSTGLMSPVMRISSTAQLEMFLADRDQDLISNNSVDITGQYGRTPYLLPGIGGGTVIPVVMKNSGLSNLNISGIGFTTAGTAASAVNWDVQNSAKTSLGQPTDLTILPGDFVVILVTVFPINGSHSLGSDFSGTLSLDRGSGPEFFSFTNGFVRDNFLYVDSTTGIDSNNGTSASPFYTLGRALMVAQDGDTIRLASSAQAYDTVYNLVDYSVIKKRIKIVGDLEVGTWVQDVSTATIDSVIVNSNPAGPKPVLAFVDTPIHGTWQANLSRVLLKGTSGADATLKLINARANFTDIRITPPEATAPENSVGLRVDGGPMGASAADVNIFSHVIIAFEGLSATPTSRSYAILNGNYNLKFVNSRFETLDGLIPQYHYGIEVQPLGAAELGDLVFQDSAVEVGLSNSTGFSRGVIVYRGSLTKKLAFHRTKFRFIGANKSGETNPSNADVALYLAQGSAGDYKPLVESSRFYFNKPQPMVGIQIASAAVRALVFQNLFGEVGNTNSSLGYRGIIDGGTETLIYNNTFSTDYNQSSGGEAKWIAIENTTSRPRIVNNLFGGLRNVGASFAGIGVHLTNSAQNPLEFRNNGFIGVTTKFWHWTLAARNTEAQLNDTGINQLSPSSGGNRVLGTGTYLYQTPTPIDFALPSNAYDGITNLETNPVVMFGGTNLTQAITAWGGPTPNWTDVAMLTVEPRRFHDISYTTPGIWSLGADEPAPHTPMKVAGWGLNGGNDPASAPASFTGSMNYAPGAQGFDTSHGTRNGFNGASDMATFFNGRTNYLLAGQVQTFQDTSAGWSVGAWFGDVSYKSHPGADPLQTIAAASDLAGNMIWRLAIKGNTRELMAEVAGQPPVKAPLPSSAQYKKWNHVFAVFDRVNSRIVLYLNGNPVPFAQAPVPVDSLVFDLTPSTGHVVALGNRQGSGIPMEEYFYGQLDDVELYNHALDPQEVAQFQSTNAAALGGTVPGIPGGPQNFIKENAPTATGTWGYLSSSNPASDSQKHVALWGFSTFAGVIRGEYWSNSNILKARSLPPTGNLDYTIQGWNSASGSMGGIIGNGAFAFNHDSGFAALLKGLWIFGGAGGRNIKDPSSPANEFTDQVGSPWKYWWDPDSVADSLSLSEAWGASPREVGSVWLSGPGGPFLKAPLTSVINVQDGNQWTVVVKFRLAAPVPDGSRIPLVTWGVVGSSVVTSQALSIGVEGAGGNDYIFVDGAGTDALFNLTPVILTETKTYTLAVSIDKAGNQAKYYLNADTSPSFNAQAFTFGSPVTPDRLVLGADQSGSRFQGWIDEVRVYSTDLLSDSTFYYALSDELDLGIYTIGSIGPGGGKVFYDKGFYTDGWRYMEAAPSDVGSVPLYGTGTENGNDAVSTSSAIGTGLNNTAILVASRTAAGNTDTAPQVADDYMYNGKSDWFLPSVDELLALYAQKALVWNNYQNGLYWSSTDTENDDAAWAVNFADGNFSSSGNWHSNGGYVRPIRRF